MRRVAVWLAVCTLSGCALPGTEQASRPEPSAQDRYVEIALSCEFADCPVGVVKPAGDVSVIVHTDMTPEQEQALSTTIAQWNAACASHPLTRDGSSEAVMDFYFVPEAGMRYVLPIYVEGNVGLFTYDWDGSNVLTGMAVAIATELEGDELTHFVLEETTQAMGLINDVADSRSIFDGGTGRTTTYSALDLEVIELHCSSAITPGMVEAELPNAGERGLD